MEVNKAVVDWFYFQATTFYAMQLKKLVQRYEKFLELNGDYMESWFRFVDNLFRMSMICFITTGCLGGILPLTNTVMLKIIFLTNIISKRSQLILPCFKNTNSRSSASRSSVVYFTDNYKTNQLLEIVKIYNMATIL